MSPKMRQPCSHIFFLIRGLTIIAALTLASCASVSGNNPHATDSSIVEILKTQEEAWAAGNAAGWARHFASGATYVTLVGTRLEGREAIEERHAILLAGPFKDTGLSIETESVLQFDGGLTLVSTRQRLNRVKNLPSGLSETAPGILEVRLTYLLAFRRGVWEIVAAQNTAIAPSAASAP